MAASPQQQRRGFGERPALSDEQIAAKQMEIEQVWHEANVRLAASLPAGMTPERVWASAKAALAKSPDLFACTARSIVGCIVEAGFEGFDVEVSGHCYLAKVRDGKTGQTYAQLRWTTKGRRERAYRSGFVSALYAVPVWSAEKCLVRQGSDPHVEHEVLLDHEKRGNLVGAYGVAKMKDGGGLIIKWVSAQESIKRCRLGKRMNTDAKMPDTYRDWPDKMACADAIDDVCKELPLAATGSAIVAAISDAPPQAVVMKGAEPEDEADAERAAQRAREEAEAKMPALEQRRADAYARKFEIIDADASISDAGRTGLLNRAARIHTGGRHDYADLPIEERCVVLRMFDKCVADGRKLPEPPPQEASGGRATDDELPF